MAVGRHRAEAGQAGNEDRRRAAGGSGRRRRSADPARRAPSAATGTRRAAARAAEAPRRPRRDPDLALWGIFLGVVTYAASTRTEIDPAAGAGTAFLVTAVFAALWWFGGRDRPVDSDAAPAAASRDDAASPVEADGALPAAAEPSTAAPASAGSAGPDAAAARSGAAGSGAASGSRRKEAAGARPPVPQHQGAPVEPLPWDAAATRRGRRRADAGHQSVPADGPSRWTRAFGPPETGSLPLQQYVPTGPLPIIVADPETLDGRQRSHSSI